MSGETKYFDAFVNTSFSFLDVFFKKLLIFRGSSQHSLLEWLPPTMSDSTTASPLIPSSDTPRVETATIEDLEPITELVMELLELQDDFDVDKDLQKRGLRLILEQPARGRIFVLRNDHKILGMVNLLFTISTARGGMVIILEDFIIHPTHRGQGYGAILVDHVKKFANSKNFSRITLLTDKLSADSQKFFQNLGFNYSSMVLMRLNLE